MNASWKQRGWGLLSLLLALLLLITVTPIVCAEETGEGNPDEWVQPDDAEAQDEAQDETEDEGEDEEFDEPFVPAPVDDGRIMPPASILRDFKPVCGHILFEPDPVRTESAVRFDGVVSIYLHMTDENCKSVYIVANVGKVMLLDTEAQLGRVWGIQTDEDGYFTSNAFAKTKQVKPGDTLELRVFPQTCTDGGMIFIFYLDENDQLLDTQYLMVTGSAGEGYRIGRFVL